MTTVECPKCYSRDQMTFTPDGFNTVTDASDGKFKCKCGHKWKALKYWRVEYSNVKTKHLMK